MNRRKKACSISKEVWNEVYYRDYGCIICRTQNVQCHHFIPRSQGGLGIKENLVMLCVKHHNAIHSSNYTKELKEHCKTYLTGLYGELDINDLKYKKRGY